ncbi:MAG: hypothetical protein WBE92_12080, partial [Steroidobacteraceae bacterium]
AVLPRSHDVALRRAIFLTRELYEAVHGQHSSDAETTRYAVLQAQLEVFVGDEVIASSYMKPLSPRNKGVWEIKNKRPKPSLRVFGLFASRDVFIGTHHQLRPPLGRFGTPMWKEQIRVARYQWRQLFGDSEPLIGELNEVISGAVYV